MKIFVSGLIIFIIIMSAVVNAAEIKTVYIIIDLSDSSPQLKLKQFAYKSANYVDDQIKELPLGSNICISTFGEYSRDKNLLSLQFKLLKKNGSRPTEVRAIVKKVIVNLPNLVKSGKLKLQKMTSLIGELKSIGLHMNSSSDNLVIILSDLLEFSADANAYELIKQTNGRLPSPKSGFLSNTDVIALGAGYGVKSSIENDRLESIWREYFNKAGVGNFRYLSYF